MIDHSVSIPCPACERKLDTHIDSASGSSEPAPGDMSICIYCGVIFVFDEGLHLRAATPAEVEGLDPKQAELVMRIRTLAKLLTPEAKA